MSAEAFVPPAALGVPEDCITLDEFIEEQRAKDPLFRELWDASHALDAALERYLAAHVAAGEPWPLPPPERRLLIHEIISAVGEIFWLVERGRGWKVKRCKRRIADQGDRSAPGVIH